jgi:hypothetical protein
MMMQLRKMWDSLETNAPPDRRSTVIIASHNTLLQLLFKLSNQLIYLRVIMWVRQTAVKHQTWNLYKR